MRLHELAKEIGAESKALLKLAKELGLSARNHSSNLAPGEIAILKAAHREEYGDTTPEPEPAGESAAAAAARRKRSRVAPTPAEERAAAAAAAAAEAAAPEVAAGEVPAEAQGTETPEAPAPAAEPGAEAAPGTLGTPIPRRRVRPTPLETTSEPGAGPAAEPVEGPPGDALRPAARGTMQPPAGGPPGTAQETAPDRPQPTPRRRSTTGARIVGKIELPQEEIRRARTTTSRAGTTEWDPTQAEAAGRGRVEHGPGAPTTDRDDRRGRAAPVKGRTDTAAWSPEEEDDPLLQGIRITNVQRGPHMRRPPRRVGPRRSSRRSPIAAPTGPVEILAPITVRDLSQALGVKANQIINVLIQKGAMAHVNAFLDEEAVLEIAAVLNREVSITTAKGKEQVFLEQVDAAEKEQGEGADADTQRLSRAPVVAFLGHVDHGKTSLLDRIRKTNVAAGEAGGITQSMRAYSVTSAAGQSITFLDTPGHKAFTEMRARGAHVTDIVVLVVAADDGVMPQTEEAIQHAKAANTPIVVALNKIDKPEANADRVLQHLANASVQVEDWGGDVQLARVSAITGQGIEELLEKISLQAEIMDLRADSERTGTGTVLEARKDEKLGAVATVLVQDGTLRVGDSMLAGMSLGRVRALINDRGENVQEAGPSTPVNVIGLDEPPDASARFYVVENLKKAREVAEERTRKQREQRVAGPAPTSAITLENLFANLAAGKVEEVRVVLKADVKGSLEVLKRELEDLKTKEVRVKTIRDALGGITEDDVLLAVASEALVIGFNVVADEKARITAETRGVQLRTYQVIYELIDDLKKAMEGLLSPLQKEVILGHVEIKEVFKVSRIGNIAGCRVTDGIVRRNAKIRLTRDGRILHTGTLSSLKRFKEDVREVKEGLECGLKIDGYDDVKVGDVVEAFEMAEEKRTLDFAKS